SDEFAFYEALAESESARQVLGDQTLSKMAHELTALVRANARIDWTKKESIRAQLRVLVKKLLKRYGYPPDAAHKAFYTVLQQAERLGINVTEGLPESEAAEAETSPKGEV